MADTVKFNPNTGAPLAKGETTTFQGKTYTGGSTAIGGTPTSSSSSSSKTSSSSSTKSAIMDLQKTLNAKTGANLVVDGIMGPKTQAALDKYNTSVKTGGGGTTTTGTKTTTTTPEVDKLQLSGKTLTSGSTGTDVKTLQTYLKANGFPNLKTDGIYGPETKTAVMQFQAKQGLTADGIVGPKTIAKYNEIRKSSLPFVDPNTKTITDPLNGEEKLDPAYDTGDPKNNALLLELIKMIKDQQAAGLKINEALNFDQATIDKFLETAKKQVHPYYAQQIDTIKQDVLRAVPQVLQNYESDIAAKEASFQEGLGGARESYAGSGLAFSGQRAKGEIGMQTEQNRNLAALSQDYGNKLYDLGRGAESKIGAKNVDYTLPSLSQYSASLGGQGGLLASGSYKPYTPGGFQLGSIPADEQAAIEARNQALKKTAQEAVVAGRSYQDLFK